MARIPAGPPWVLSTRELQDLGFSKDRVAQRVAMGHLHRVHRGVYAIGRPELSFEGRCRAAWLACGEASAISHITAAAGWNVRQSTGRIHVSVPRSRRGPPGLIVHRPRSLTADDVVRHGAGFMVTSVARTLLDMSPGQPVDTVGRWLHEAEVQRVLDVRQVHALLEREPHHRGNRVLKAALSAEVVDTRTRLEATVLGLWRKAGLPDPKANRHVWSSEKLEEVDLVCPELGLIVEADGTAVHASRWRRRRDAAKTARLRAAGWTVIRVPELRATLEPAAVIADLRAAAARGRPNSS